MDTVAFLEELAKKPHHAREISILINQQPDEIKASFLTNNSELLKNQINNSLCTSSTTVIL